MAHENAPAFQSRERFLAAAQCLPVDRTPIWMMRQAGRSLPEYRELKKKHSFTEIVKTPELAAEATLQPIRRFGFDAAVLFSDILIVPEAMGQSYSFHNGTGIEMAFTVRSAEEIQRLEHRGVAGRLDYVANALKLVKSALAGQTAMLGFAGSPWTLANFMMGGAHESVPPAKALFYRDPCLFGELMEKLTLAVTEALQLQIDAGADAVQIFDSCGGMLADNAFEPASGRWIRQIIEGINRKVPVILFSKGTNGQWESLASTGANVLSVDWTQPLAKVRACLPRNVGVQGNLDPAILTTTPEIAANETRRILHEMKGATGHIFNLGHGVPPEARLDCIEAVAETVRHFL